MTADRDSVPECRSVAREPRPFSPGMVTRRGYVPECESIRGELRPFSQDMKVNESSPCRGSAQRSTNNQDDVTPENTASSTPPATPPRHGGPSTDSPSLLHEIITLLLELPGPLQRAVDGNTIALAWMGAVVLLTAVRLGGGLILPGLRSPTAQKWLTVGSRILRGLEPLADGDPVSALSVVCAMLHAATEALESSQRQLWRGPRSGP